MTPVMWMNLASPLHPKMAGWTDQAGWADQAPPLHLQSRQASYDFHGLQTHRDDPLEQFQRVARVTHGFRRPVVGVVDDAALLVGLDALSFHHSIQRRFAVDDVGARHAVPH